MKFDEMEKLESALGLVAEVLECQVEDVLAEIAGKLINDEDYYELLDFINES